MQIFDVVNDLRKSGTDGIAAVTGIAAVESIKDHDIAVLIFVIPLHHRQLVQIGEQCQV